MGFLKNPGLPLKNQSSIHQAPNDHSRPTRMVIILKTQEISISEDMEKLDPPSTAGGNIKWCSHNKQVWRFLKKLKIQLPYIFP